MGDKKRIEYVDTLKGICICLVSLTHAYLFKAPENHYFSFALMLRMPLYFFVCGIFYSSYNSSFKTLLLKKANKLIIPIIGFSLLDFMASIPMNWSVWQEAGWLWSPGFFVNAVIGGGSLWFLRCLFFMYVFYYFITEIICKKMSEKRCDIVIFVIGLSMWFVNSYLLELSEDIMLIKALFFLKINVALIVLPIMRVAIRLKPYLFDESKFGLRAICLCAVLWISMRLLAGDLTFKTGEIGDNYVFALIGMLSAVICVWLIIRKIKYIPLITYMGRYSLIVLGTHMLVVRLVEEFVTKNHFVIMAITFVTAFPIIYLVKTYLPHISAQKDLLILEENYIKIKISRYNIRLWKFQ